MKKIVKIVAGSLWALPVLALAQNTEVGFGFFEELTESGTSLLNDLVVFLVALAVVWFIFNVIRYTISADENKKSAAKGQMIWGIVAIAVIVSIWGLVGILQGMFGADGTAAAKVPKLPTFNQ